MSLMSVEQIKSSAWWKPPASGDGLEREIWEARAAFLDSLFYNYSGLELISTRRSMLEYLATLPPGPLLYKTPEEANRYLQEERDSWER